MISIGVDAHKSIHVAVGLDEAGQLLGQWQGPNSEEGWGSFHGWVQGLGGVRQIGIEGAWGYGRGLAQHLVAAGETVYEINSRWTAQARRGARRRGKADRLDAAAVAAVVRRDGPTLPHVTLEDDTAILDLMVTERDDALVEATRLRNRAHQLLVQLDPEYRLHLPSLQTKAGLKALEEYAVDPGASTIQQARAASVRRLAQRLRLTLDHAHQLEQEIKALAKRSYEPLTRLCGINLLTAGALAGILGPGHRFATDAQLAAYAGAAPLEASSAGLVRHRLNRGGNRRLNAILYLIVLTQARHSAQTRAYLKRRRAEGRTSREAFRALKRYIVRAIWRLWQECVPACMVTGPAVTAQTSSS
jgi:transposase